MKPQRELKSQKTFRFCFKFQKMASKLRLTVKQIWRDSDYHNGTSSLIQLRHFNRAFKVIISKLNLICGANSVKVFSFSYFVQQLLIFSSKKNKQTRVVDAKNWVRKRKQSYSSPRDIPIATFLFNSSRSSEHFICIVASFSLNRKKKKFVENFEFENFAQLCQNQNYIHFLL